MNAMEPAEEVEIWAPILADPLDWPPSSVTVLLPSQVEEYFSSMYGVDDMEIKQFAQEPEDLIVKENWRRGPRGPRRRRVFPSGSGGMNFHRRKNNEHWTHEEVKKLVKGVKTYGAGKWTMVKSHYFSSSVRDPTHLKDKWRNLLRACGVMCASKRKEKAQKTMFLPLDTNLIEQIQGLAIDSAFASKMKKCHGKGTIRLEMITK
ncbi:hypothetical protein CFC21_099077 [Triticum aestivum]|uniref:Myb-like domain-containing protein n=3 Tax=Triticum TaxID=4564 RepID=A0A9R1LYK6_WHEAT|nr:uncharacterized protein LOC123152612 isoform X2 [Triticum aestivum]KAF7097231.1 hypothetical protein CFC21_099076 [Triticum aestivum]KAF7097233.1 hypothetical protein CFC21_099077 [Triticum aestivum]VAI78572.1 unnamed protein product [Triticum turgidum subsp. durum]